MLDLLSLYLFSYLPSLYSLSMHVPGLYYLLFVVVFYVTCIPAPPTCSPFLFSLLLLLLLLLSHTHSVYINRPLPYKFRFLYSFIPAAAALLLLLLFLLLPRDFVLTLSLLLQPTTTSIAMDSHPCMLYIFLPTITIFTTYKITKNEYYLTIILNSCPVSPL